jgi:hypothetical protein
MKATLSRRLSAFPPGMPASVGIHRLIVSALYRPPVEPDDVPRRILDVVGLAVQVILRVDLRAFALVGIHQLIHRRRITTALRLRTGLRIQVFRLARVPQRQIRRPAKQPSRCGLLSKPVSSGIVAPSL